MTTREFFIALDQGSSSSRALAIDTAGQIACASQFPVKIFQNARGFVEHDAWDIARTQEKALDQVLSRLPRNSKVLGLGIACQRSTVVCWDRKTGRPVGRALSWQDSRAADLVGPLQDEKESIHRRTGLYPTPYYSAPKIQWLLKNNRHARALADQGRLIAAPVATYLIWRLTRGALFACDPTLAQRMLLLNLKTLSWDPELLKEFSIPREILPEILPSVGETALITRGGRRFPLLTCLGDQQAAAVGLGLEKPHSAVANYGTGAFLLYHAGANPLRVPGLLTSVGAGLEKQAPAYFIEGTVNAAGACLDWLQRAGFVSDLGEIQKACEASTQRLWSTPAVGGLGAPYWQPKVPGIFLGLNALAGKADIVRSGVETIAWLVSDIAKTLTRHGLRFNGLTVGGGVSRLDYLMQFQADLLQTPLRRLRQTEATASGIAALSAAALKMTVRKPKVERVFRPRVSAKKAHDLSLRWDEFISTQRKLALP